MTTKYGKLAWMIGLALVAFVAIVTLSALGYFSELHFLTEHAASSM
jgi:hypothetical protein